jgi:glutamate-ammonia-ligase adenylyltransferase
MRHSPDAGRATSLAGRIVAAPQLIDAETAHARVADWLATLPPNEAAPLAALLAERPLLATLLASLAESSPYLWDLASREPARLMRLLAADPDAHFAAVLAEHGEAAAMTDD